MHCSRQLSALRRHRLATRVLINFPNVVAGAITALPIDNNSKFVRYIHCSGRQESGLLIGGLAILGAGVAVQYIAPLITKMGEEMKSEPAQSSHEQQVKL